MRGIYIYCALSYIKFPSRNCRIHYTQRKYSDSVTKSHLFFSLLFSKRIELVSHISSSSPSTPPFPKIFVSPRGKNFFLRFQFNYFYISKNINISSRTEQNLFILVETPYTHIPPSPPSLLIREMSCKFRGRAANRDQATSDKRESGALLRLFLKCARLATVGGGEGRDERFRSDSLICARCSARSVTRVSVTHFLFRAQLEGGGEEDPAPLFSIGKRRH